MFVCWCAVGGEVCIGPCPNSETHPVAIPPKQAFPYIAKRLMTDDSPRLQEALRYMVRLRSRGV